jgi:hypothetical protein
MLGWVDRIEGLNGIVSAWTRHWRSALRRGLVALFLASLPIAVLLARRGTPYARIGGAGILVAVVAFIGVFSLWRRRCYADVARLARAIVAKHDRPLAGELGRAIGLLDRTRRQAPRASLELAELHLQRVLSRVSIATLESLARKRAGRLQSVANSIIAMSVACMFLFRTTLIEGADVLLAQNGIGPWSVQLVELESVRISPPPYLHGAPDDIDFDMAAAQPAGSRVVVQGIALRPNLTLVLAGQGREIAFVSDGRGGVTARTVLEHSTRLRVAARFGNVLLRQSSELALEAVPDLAPVVLLEDAPRHVSIGDVSEVDLHYRATDDHGIRQIDLLLRGGTREERRMLVRLDGDTRQYAGAYSLDVEDSFVKSSYGPVDLRVVARDDNDLDGASWGQSAAITLDRPALGRAQAQQREVYLKLRNQLLDWMAALRARPRAGAETNGLRMRSLELLANTEPGAKVKVGVQGAMRTFLRAQRDKLLHAELSGGPLVTVLEEVCLAIDSAMEAIAARDAQHVAGLLADVAVEIESAARAAGYGEHGNDGVARVTSAQSMLFAGATELKRLSTLGEDLGEVALAGWHRIERARSVGDFVNVERAASFLAQRLRRPSPSFLGGGRAGVGSGVRSPARGAAPKASEADLHLERVAMELRQLARDHAAEIEAVERIVGDIDHGLGSSELGPEARRHADALRVIVEGLPSVGAAPGSVRAALALAKELTHGAAELLMRLQLAGAYDGLRKADAALMEAEMLGDEALREQAGLQHGATQELRRHLAEHRDWVKRTLDQSSESAQVAMRDLLRQSASREQEIAERAKRLSMRESKSDSVLPEDLRSDLEHASHLMRQAAEMLEGGRGKVALQRQRSAQNLIERADAEPDDAPSPSAPMGGNSDRASSARAAASKGSVVSTSDVESREEFRRRVQKGLSYEVTPELSPAVRRYAEGLLK